MTFLRWQWSHPAIALEFLDGELARQAEEVSGDSPTSRFVARADLSLKNLSRPKMAPGS